MVSLTKLPVDVPIEGDYSAWTEKWTVYDTDFSAALYLFSVITADELKALIVNEFDFIIFNIADGTYTWYEDFNSANFMEYVYQMAHYSTFNKYFGIIDRDRTSLRIYKDGVLVDTLTVDDAANDHFEGLAVALSGKYIVVYYYDGSPVARSGFRCYEGA